MTEKNDTETTSDETRPRTDSGKTSDASEKSWANMNAMYLIAIDERDKFKAALKRVRVFIDGSAVIEGEEWEDLSDILKAVVK